MDQNPAEATGSAHGDIRSIENGFRSIWERARRAAELITQLREEKRDLQGEVNKLSAELRQLREELGRKEQLLKKISSEPPPARAGIIANGERDALVTKVKDLLAKLEAHL